MNDANVEYLNLTIMEKSPIVNEHMMQAFGPMKSAKADFIE